MAKKNIASKLEELFRHEEENDAFSFDEVFSEAVDIELGELSETSRSHFDDSMKDGVAFGICGMFRKSLYCCEPDIIELTVGLKLLAGLYHGYVMPNKVKKMVKRIMDRFCEETQRLNSRERLFAYKVCMSRRGIEVPVDVARLVYEFSKTVVVADQRVANVMLLGCGIFEDHCDSEEPVTRSVVAAVPTIILAMRQHPDSLKFQLQAFKTLGNIAANSDEGRNAILSARGMDTIADVMKMCRSKANRLIVETRGIMALAYIACGSSHSVV